MTSTAPRVFVINPGSTSTKLALFAGAKAVFDIELSHPRKTIEAFDSVMAQAEFRRSAALGALADHGVDLAEVDVFVGRGGLLRPVPSGTFRINKRMLADLRSARYGQHASNLGAMLAWELARKHRKPSFIANPVVVDELWDVARVSGLPDLPRQCPFHALSHKAVAAKAAARLGKPYSRCNLIVAHLGGGITIGAHRRGRVVDVNHGLHGEGPFTPERSGAITTLDFYRYGLEKGLSLAEATKLLTRRAGLVAHLGTNDCRKIEANAAAGNKKHALVYDALIYQVAKQIGAMAAAMSGKVDAIVLTGGMVRGKRLVARLRRMISFVAPVYIILENSEMQALAAAALDVVTGKSEARIY